MVSPAGAEAERALRLLAEALRRPGATAVLQVTGDCMRPLVRSGDRVTLRGLTWPPPVGALVVAVAAEGAPVCHRVVALASDGAVELAGDRTVVAERHRPEAVVGLVDEVRRGDRCLLLCGERPSCLDRVVAALHRRAAARRAAGTRVERRLAGLLFRGKRLAAAVRSLAWRRAL